MKRRLNRFVLTLSLLGFAVSLHFWIDSYWHSRRIGWVSIREDSTSVTFTIKQLYNRRGQAELSFHRNQHDGVSLAQATRRESYFAQQRGPILDQFPGILGTVRIRESQDHFATTSLRLLSRNHSTLGLAAP